jgi:NADH dehydrogenase (ubiquinone) Fe-S protein 3
MKNISNNTILNYNTLILNYINNLKSICPINCIQLTENEIILTINNVIVPKMLLFLKRHVLSQVKSLSCISGIDYPEKKFRFKVVYELTTLRYNNRLRIKTYNDELKPIKSVINVHATAKWHEAETWDMFGIFFENHLNLTRLLTDYGFEGFPGRKNFPLTGYVEARYNETKKSVVREPLELSHEYRNFKFLSIWEEIYIYRK